MYAIQKEKNGTAVLVPFSEKNSVNDRLRVKVLSAGTLKTIALVTMLLDHIGAILIGRCVLQPAAEIPAFIYAALRALGRMSCPLFAFLLVEGFLHTKDLKRYIVRMAIFAVLSEVPFDFAFFGVPLEFTYQNNIFTLFLSLLMLSSIKESGKRWYLTLPAIIGTCAVTYFLHTDYAVFLPALTAVFYLFRRDRIAAFLIGTTVVTLANVSFASPAGLISGAAAVLMACFLYNGKKGRSFKKASYAFYPLHLLILGSVAVFLLRNA